MAAAIVIATVVRHVIVGGVVARLLVLPALGGQIVVDRVVTCLVVRLVLHPCRVLRLGRVMHPGHVLDLGCVRAAMVMRAIVDSVHP